MNYLSSGFESVAASDYFNLLSQATDLTDIDIWRQQLTLSTQGLP